MPEITLEDDDFQKLTISNPQWLCPIHGKTEYNITFTFEGVEESYCQLCLRDFFRKTFPKITEAKE